MAVMNIKYYVMYFFLLNVVHYASADCWFSEKYSGWICHSEDDLPLQSTETWTKLLLYSALDLEKDTFKYAPNLEYLECHNIASMEEGTFNGLNKLILKLFFVTLEEIPLGILDNLPIRQLVISFSELKNIQPGLINKIPQLEKIELTDNSIKEIQKGVFDSTNISVLYLINNKIENITPKAFENMTKLNDLSLKGNLLKSFNSELLFGSCETLYILWLANNYLTKVTKDMFATIPNLLQLSLEVNKIEAIEYGSFDKLPKLLSIDISNNKIQTLQPRIFPYSGMKSLISLSLHNNKLTYINQALLLRTPNLKYITYAGNPFQCPCHLQLKKYISKRNITRICDQDYLEGTRPVCVYSSVEPDECLYDEDQTEDLYQVYVEAVKDYPKLELKCDTTIFKNATLIRFA